MKNKIISKSILCDNVCQLRIGAPRIAKKRMAGQFVIIQPTDKDERIPLTIANSNPDDGWIELIIQVVGYTTQVLCDMNEGDSVAALAGPLGKPTEIEKFGKVVCIGGGVGIAPLYPIVSAMAEAGNEVTTIIGARNKDLLILEEEMKDKSDRLLIATDDGSYGHHGFAADVFKKLVDDGETFDKAVVIGPSIMMKVTTKATIERKIPTVASLNPIMVDGTGMCGGCRVTVDGKTRFACVDGPEFDADGIDWDELQRRLNAYSVEEKEILEHHSCKLGLKA